MSTAYGIDLGTTNSVIARLSGGRPVPIPIAGSAIVPSVVLFHAGKVAVGREARNLALQHPEHTVRSVKRKMGQEHRYQIGDRELTPEQVSAEILGALKRGAEAATGEVVHDVVITVPAYFNDAQRRATLAAGELAGLNVLRLLNEPTSASLVYDQVQLRGAGGPAGAEPEVVMIYDLGGGTFDVSVLEVFGGVREVRSTTGNSHLGGDDLDELLVRLFCDELQRQEGVSAKEDLRAMARLRDLAERTKIALSEETAVQAKEEFLLRVDGRPVHLDLKVTRRRFEELIEPLLTSTVELARRALREARLGDGQRLQRICMVGGSTRIPMVRRLLEEAFDAEVHEEVDPDLAVGLGAAVQSGLLQGEEVERILVDVSAHSLGIRVLGQEDDPYGATADTFAPVLRRNTALPAERTEEFYTICDNQSAFEVEVFQGEAPRVSQNSSVGSFLYKLAPAPAHSPVQVGFAYDLNGVVKVSVAQAGMRNEKTVAFQIADAGPKACGAAGPEARAPQSAVERKAEALMASLPRSLRAELQGLLERFRGVGPEERELAEERLLDFFLAHGDEA